MWRLGRGLTILSAALLLGLQSDGAGNRGSAGPPTAPPRPTASLAREELALAARHAPVIAFDRLEPFFPTFAGVTVFRGDAPSPSFPRQVTLRPRFPEISDDNAREIARLFPDGRLPQVPDLTAALVLEYAIWWDWDIQHLYELEHIWSYVGADGRLLYAEASWHGSYFPMLWQGDTPRQDDRPLVYSQPGKHAFAPNPALFTATVQERENLRRACFFRAGSGGLLLKDELFRGKIAKDSIRDAIAGGHLKGYAFDPSFEFTRTLAIDAPMLVPWPALYDWIPRRVDQVLWEIGEWRFAGR